MKKIRNSYWHMNLDLNNVFFQDSQDNVYYNYTWSPLLFLRKIVWIIAIEISIPFDFHRLKNSPDTKFDFVGESYVDLHIVLK